MSIFYVFLDRYGIVLTYLWVYLMYSSICMVYSIDILMSIFDVFLGRYGIVLTYL